MMATTYYCGQCASIERTSSKQLFWRCRRHAGRADGDPLRCHVQPWAAPCDFFCLPVNPASRFELALTCISLGVPSLRVLRAFDIPDDTPIGTSGLCGPVLGEAK